MALQPTVVGLSSVGMNDMCSGNDEEKHSVKKLLGIFLWPYHAQHNLESSHE